MSEVDSRIVRGTVRMLAFRDVALAGGAEHLGWKAGFGAPAAQAALGTDGPLVGYLTRDRLVTDGSVVDVSTWTRPVLEAEVAAYLGADLGAHASSAEARAAVERWSVAIELADLDRSPDDVGEILAGNIYHRHVLLGPAVDVLPDPLSFRVLRDDVEAAATDEPEALTGELGSVLAAMAATLASCGSALRAGDVVITGSVVAPLPAVPGAWTVREVGLGALSVVLR
jgi:2-keto-4-pentenoate hydratase